MKKETEEIIRKLIDATYDTGYNAGVDLHTHMLPQQMEEWRAFMQKQIAERNKLTQELRAAIEAEEQEAANV